MAATANQKATVLNVLKQADAYCTALQTAVHTAINSLDGSSTSAQLDTAVDAYTTIRNAAYTTYGGIQMPALSATDSISAVAAEAHA